MFAIPFLGLYFNTTLAYNVLIGVVPARVAPGDHLQVLPPVEVPRRGPQAHIGGSGGMPLFSTSNW